MHDGDEQNELDDPRATHEEVAQAVVERGGDEVQGEDGKEERRPDVAHLGKLGEVSGIEARRDAYDHFASRIEAIGTEENEEEDDPCERERPRKKSDKASIRQSVEPHLAPLVQAEGDAVACAPGDERPRGAVPESAEEHGHE